MTSAPLIEAVYRAERARVLATTIRVIHGDFDLAEEVVQETFAAAMSSFAPRAIRRSTRSAGA